MTRLVPRVSHEQSGGYTLLSGPWRRQHAVLALGGSGGGGGHVHSSSDPLLSVPMAPGLPWDCRRNRHTDWPSSYLRVCTQVQGHRSPKRPPAAIVPLCGLGIVPGNIAKVSSWSQTFGKCRVSGSLCSPEASSLGLGQTLPCSSKVSVKVSSWVWLNPEQRQVGLIGVGGSHESLHGDVGPAHLRGGLQGGRGPCLR